ncbi:MAG: DUF2088 domain-containing protein, partial [Anaerolineae bacterium]|nr:DUF2088 domain-containing protein [Anaerolineae bacterium]
MRVNLAYGRSGLDIDLPDRTDVLTPRFVAGLPDEPAALLSALRTPIDSPPLADLVKPGDTVVV